MLLLLRDVVVGTIVALLIIGIGMATLLALPGCAAEGSRFPSLLFDRCYEISVQHELLERADSLLFRPPAAVRLRPEAWNQERFVLRPSPETMPVSHVFANWRVAEADTLELVWSTGHDGILVRTALDGDTLRGRSETVHDGGDGAHGTAVLVRVPCERTL